MVSITEQLELFGTPTPQSHAVNDIANNFTAYGVTEGLLKGFSGELRGNYTALESIVIGLHNIIVPHKILQNLNSAEILALYISIGELKKYGELCFEKNGSRTRVYRSQFEQKEFPEQISMLVQYAYERYWRVRGIKEEGFSQHPHGPGRLKKRMQLIGAETRQQFLGSLQQPYIRMQRFDGDEGLPNPNPDGNRGKEGKQRLINFIIPTLSEIYGQTAKN